MTPEVASMAPEVASMAPEIASMAPEAASMAPGAILTVRRNTADSENVVTSNEFFVA